MPTATPPPAAPERITAALDLLSMTQAELADREGLRQPTISAIIGRTRPLTPQVYDRLLKATGLPTSFFAAHDVIDPDRVLFRRRRTAPSRTTKRAKRMFAELFRVSAALMESSRQPVPNLPIVPFGERIDGVLSEDRIETAAQAARDSLGLKAEGPVASVLRALERAHVPGAPIVFDDDPEERPAHDIGHDGISERLSDGRAVIAYFPSRGDRQRFTLAHELGHLILHHDREHLDDSTAESEADRFAGAFLVPVGTAQRVLNRRLDLRDYARAKAELGVSIQALVQRAFALDFMDESRRTSLFKQLSARGWRREEPVTVRAEQPLLLPKLLAHRYGPELSYRGRVSELGLPPMILRSLIPPPGPEAVERAAAVVPLK